MERNVIEKPPVDVLIVGAGLSGLTSACKLLEKDRNLSVRILECSTEVGGKLRETHLGQVGAKWISEDQHHMRKLLETFDIPMQPRADADMCQPAPNQLKRCWDLDCGVMAPLAKFELQRYMRELELRMSKYRVMRYRFGQQTESMETHITSSLFFSASRQFMRNIVLLVSGAPANQINYEEFMTICASCGGLSRLIDIYLLCPPTLFEFSSHQLLCAMLRKLCPIEILTDRKVEELRPKKDFIEVYDNMLCKHKASVVILAIPWSGIQNIYMASPLPAEYEPPLQIVLRKSNYSMSSFLIKYTTSPWRIAGYSGHFMRNEPFIFGYEYRTNIYCCHIIHHAHSNFNWEYKVVHILAQHFGEAMLLPTELARHTFELSYLRKAAAQRIVGERIILSSSSVAATCNCGCLAGAVQSGMQAALRALLVVRPQTVSWQDEAELRCCSNTNYGVGWLTLWESSLNLYNVTCYGMLIGGVLGALSYFSGKQ